MAKAGTLPGFQLPTADIRLSSARPLLASRCLISQMMPSSSVIQKDTHGTAAEASGQTSDVIACAHSNALPRKGAHSFPSLSLSLFACLSLCQSIYLSVCLWRPLPVYLSVCRSLYLSICLPLSSLLPCPCLCFFVPVPVPVPVSGPVPISLSQSLSPLSFQLSPNCTAENGNAATTPIWINTTHFPRQNGALSGTAEWKRVDTRMA